MDTETKKSTKIEEINEWQLQVLTDLSSIHPTLLLVAPHVEDSPDQRQLREQSNKNADQLLTLELIEDANKEGMFAAYLNNIQPTLGGRSCRIFRITDLGFKMFSTVQEKVTIH